MVPSSDGTAYRSQAESITLPSSHQNALRRCRACFKFFLCARIELSDSSISQKEDPVFMMMLRNCAKDKRDLQQSEAKSLLKKIETDSKLTEKEEKWIASFKSDHMKFRKNQNELDDENEEYQIDQADLVSPERAIETYSKGISESDDQLYKQTRDKFFTMETVEDILAESKRKQAYLNQELARIALTGAGVSADEMRCLVDQIRKEEETQKKNTSVHVWSLTFEKIRESPEIQDNVQRCERILLRHFFHAHFLPGQLLSIICALTRACDCVASMRTGGGKTMIFAIPALLEDEKTTIVFSPLRSLILDQMNEMKKLGIESGLQLLPL